MKELNLVSYSEAVNSCASCSFEESDQSLNENVKCITDVHYRIRLSFSMAEGFVKHHVFASNNALIRKDTVTFLGCNFTRSE